MKRQPIKISMAMEGGDVAGMLEIAEVEMLVIARNGNANGECQKQKWKKQKCRNA